MAIFLKNFFPLVFQAFLAYSWSTGAPSFRSGRFAALHSTRSTNTLDGLEIRGPITPVSNYILVKVKDTLTATTGGILLPDQAQERPTEGVALSCGPGKIHPFTAKLIHNPIKEGMSVLYGKFDGKPLEYNGEECQMIRDDNVLLAYEGVTMKLENVQPIRDWVLIELVQEDLETKSGVVIASQVTKDLEPCQGTVVKIGEGRLSSEGELTQSPVEVGDFVKFKDYAGNPVMIEGKEYTVVKMVDILSTKQTQDEL